MAKGSAKSAKPAKTGSLRPMLIAAGLGLFWFVEFQGGGSVDAPGWGAMVVLGVRLLADFVGAWVVVSAVRLACSLARFGLAYLHALWMRSSA